MKSSTKPPKKTTLLAWEQLECFGSSHPQELMIFREGIRLIPYSLLLLPPMDIWHIGRRPSIFQESFDLGPRHSTPPCVQINIPIHILTWEQNFKSNLFATLSCEDRYDMPEESIKLACMLTSLPGTFSVRVCGTVASMDHWSTVVL